MSKFVFKLLDKCIQYAGIQTAIGVAVSSSPRPWIDVFVLPEKSNMAVTESDPDLKVWKMSITF